MRRGPKPRLTDKEFAKIWRSSSSWQEVADRTGMKISSIGGRKSAMENRGYSLESMVELRRKRALVVETRRKMSDAAGE